MTEIELVAVGVVAILGGAVNALAGGGTLITFPVLTALGVPAVAANVTNTVALCPGYLGGALAQRGDLRDQRARLARLLPAALAGGLAGGLLLLGSGERAFRALVPFLILLASLLLAAQGGVRRLLVARSGGAPVRGAERWSALAVGAAAVYGGYFGAGLSVIVLAALGLLLHESLTRLNAAKQVVAL